MNQELIYYARELNLHDTKTLSQKLAKTMEEVGELASKILPFEDASGVVHRFTDKNSILEEAVDVILCAQSIIHELGYTDEEADQMFNRKLKKWGSIQDDEKKVAGKPIPYEIHVTVKLPDRLIESFKIVCEEIGVKPIVLELQLGTSGVMQDVMTSSVHFGTNRSAYDEMTRISDALEQTALFVVVREKIETVPWHPASPKDVNDVMPKDCYFESHLAIVCDAEVHETLSALAYNYGFHLSKNAFKTIDDTHYIMMATYRVYAGNLSLFTSEVHTLRTILVEKYGFIVEKEIIEFSIYDTKISHDAEWLKK